MKTQYTISQRLSFNGFKQIVSFYIYSNTDDEVKAFCSLLEGDVTIKKSLEFNSGDYKESPHIKELTQISKIVLRYPLESGDRTYQTLKPFKGKMIFKKGVNKDSLLKVCLFSVDLSDEYYSKPDFYTIDSFFEV